MMVRVLKRTACGGLSIVESDGVYLGQTDLAKPPSYPSVRSLFTLFCKLWKTVDIAFLLEVVSPSVNSPYISRHCMIFPENCKLTPKFSSIFGSPTDLLSTHSTLWPVTHTRARTTRYFNFRHPGANWTFKPRNPQPLAKITHAS